MEYYEVHTNTSFATLPAHFVDGFNISDDEWDLLLPGYRLFPKGFQHASKYLLASIVNFKDYLKLKLHPNHPLFSTYLFSSGNLDKLAANLVVTNTETELRPTGIPPHLTLVKELADCKSEIIAQRNDLPKLLTEEIRNKFKFAGNKEITFDKMEQLMEKYLKEIKQQVNSNNNCKGNSIINSYNNVNNLKAWGGRLHSVPQGFELPTSNIKNLWNLWWFGHANNQYPPYRYLSGLDFTTVSQKTQLSKTATVMKYIEQVAKTRGYVDTNIKFEHLTQLESSKIFDLAFADLLKTILKPSLQSRLGELSVSTLYDHLPKPAVKKRKYNIENRNAKSKKAKPLNTPIEHSISNNNNNNSNSNSNAILLN
ncbi:MAG: hypothetical protein ACXWFB_13195 [Nitrososphaeraceae archaeon]